MAPVSTDITTAHRPRLVQIQQCVLPPDNNVPRSEALPRRPSSKRKRDSHLARRRPEGRITLFPREDMSFRQHLVAAGIVTHFPKSLDDVVDMVFEHVRKYGGVLSHEGGVLDDEDDEGWYYVGTSEDVGREKKGVNEERMGSHTKDEMAALASTESQGLLTSP